MKISKFGLTAFLLPLTCISVLFFTGCPTDNTESPGSATYGVTIPELSNGAITLNTSRDIEGTAIQLTITPDQGYGLKVGSLGYTIGSADMVPITPTEKIENDVLSYTASFPLPASDVTLGAEFVLSPHKVIVDPSAQTLISPNVTRVAEGAIVTLVFSSPVSSVTVKKGNVPVLYTLNENKLSATFTMPAADVTVNAVAESASGEFEIVDGVSGGGTIERVPATDGLRANTGDEVKLKIRVPSDKQLNSNVVVQLKDGPNTIVKTIQLQDVIENGNIISFFMPRKDVRVLAGCIALGGSAGFLVELNNEDAFIDRPVFDSEQNDGLVISKTGTDHPRSITMSVNPDFIEPNAANTGYTYEWYIDGLLQGNNGYVFTIDAENYSQPGKHILTVIAYRRNASQTPEPWLSEPYSESKIFTVTK
ncbi:MAG: hypothetical protein LBD29_11245 [Treponema sp.]|jgi:hypothetical protein|nr:hypothetical protein [Treponema sp.]